MTSPTNKQKSKSYQIVLSKLEDSKSLDGLNSSLAQSPGELGSSKVAQISARKMAHMGHMRCLNTYEPVTRKVAIIYKTQNILQLKDIYNLPESKLMCKYTNSKLPATFNKHFKLMTDVHPYNTRQTKTRQFALPKAHSSSGENMSKHSVQ